MRAADLTRVLSATLACAVLFVAGCSEQKPAEKKAEAEKTEPATGRQPTKVPAKVPVGKGFDFYVLSLSWSPTWCADNDPSGRSQQCRRDNAYGFIVHGLWPQNDRGYPEFCPTREPDRVPDSLGRTILDIIPSMGLIGHQWRKHGSCSGLTQKDYFSVTRAARERIAIPRDLDRPARETRLSPDAVEDALIAANPGLKRSGVAVTCEGGRLEEVRICLTADLAFRPCPQIDNAGCRAKSFSVPPVR